LKHRLARLNHILVPSSRRERERYRSGHVSRRLRTLSGIFARLSREGRALSSMASLALLFGADLGRGQAHLLSLATLALVASALIVSLAYRSRGLSAALVLPQRVTVGDELSIGIELANEGPRERHRLRLEPPPLPWDGRFTDLPPDIPHLEPGARRRVFARARFASRGAHHLDPFRVAPLVPLGLAQGSPISTQGASFLVVPRIARVTQVNTPRNRRHQPGGIAGASRTGDTSDLAGVRPYRPGDPLRDLHARSWARLGTPMVRQYQEEFFTRIGVVVDTDASAGTPAHLEGALSLSAGIIARLCSGEALVDVLITGQHTERLALGRHLASLERALDVLAAVQATPQFESDHLLGQLGPHMERLSSVVLVALTWNEARAALVSAIEARGVGVLAVVVGELDEPTPRARAVPLDVIQNGEITL
jgi:uncharacterized protein (DUF58 family)